MKVIGFTNKFYTLWEVTEETKPLGNGRSMHVVHNIYIKNISFDREKAFAAYPGVEFSEDLRGHSASFDRPEIIWTGIDTFRFGKYDGQKIEEINDVKYTAWYWEQVWDEHRNFVSEYLKKNGYEVRTRTWTGYNGDVHNDEYLMSPEALIEEKKYEEELNNIVKSLETGNEINLVPETNLNEDGEYRDGDVIYKFSETKEMYYNGFYYYLPLKNGKAKRFKNKNVVIKTYTFEKTDNYILVNVIDFDIVK